MSAQDYYNGGQPNSQDQYHGQQQQQQQQYQQHQQQQYQQHQASQSGYPQQNYGAPPVQQYGYGSNSTYNQGVPPPFPQPSHGTSQYQQNPSEHQYSGYQVGQPPAGYNNHPNDSTGYPSQYGQHQTGEQVGYGRPGQTNPQSEEDRGLMGALAGGAMGGYGGHQINHGFLGTIGGAIAGSKIEDHYKKGDKKNKKKKEKKHGSRSSGSSSSSSSSDDEKKKKKHSQYAAIGGTGAAATAHYQNRGAQGGAIAGNFSGSSSNITMDNDYDLIASCIASDGSQRLSSVSLNNILTNSGGEFRWAKGGNFGGSARHVSLEDGGRVLTAELANMSGGWSRAMVRLDERITNENGALKFLE